MVSFKSLGASFFHITGIFIEILNKMYLFMYSKYPLCSDLQSIHGSTKCTSKLDFRYLGILHNIFKFVIKRIFFVKIYNVYLRKSAYPLH